MNDKQIDELINRALNDEHALPEGLSERLEQYIDTLPATEHRPKNFSLLLRQALYWSSGAAAAIVIGLALFFNTRQSQPKDTFTNPQEAAIAAQKVLEMVSGQLNEGLAQVAEVEQEIEKVNKIIHNPTTK